MLKESFLHQFRHNNRQRNLIVSGDKIVVAVSGGIDSLVLLDCLSRLKEELNIQLLVAHFNHKLRAQESEEDEQFVRSIAEQYKLPFHTHHGQTAAVAEEEKQSVQEAARNLRYDFLKNVRETTGFDKIATAHNANDNAETVLFNLLRGAGVKGLCGIPVSRADDHLIRPLLFATREQIQQYAVEHGIVHREDSSNKKTVYSRNFLRHNIIPLLQQSINNNLIETLNRSSDIFVMLDSYLQSEHHRLHNILIKETSLNKIVLNRELFAAQPEFMQYYVLYTLVKDFTQDELSFDTVKEMLSISTAETGSWCALNEQTKLYRDRNELILIKQAEQKQFQVPIPVNEDIRLNDFLFSSSFVNTTNFSNNRNIEYIDAQKLGTILSLRSWKHGDWFIPLGMMDKKKLSDFFIEQKIPLFQKQSVPILTSDDSIVWVCGQRLDERFKVTMSTTTILKLEYQPIL